MKKIAFVSFLLACLMAGTAGFAQTADFPGWRGVNRDGKVAGFKAPATWPKELAKVWEVPVGLGDASPVMVKGRIYVLVTQDSVETLLCIDAKSGKEIWKSPIDREPKLSGGGASHPGPRGTPHVSDGRVFTLGATGIVACLDAKKGKLLWKTDAFTKEVPQFYTSASPLVTDKLCIYPLGGKENGVVAAFDVKTGAVVWQVSGPSCVYSSPVFITVDQLLIVDQSETALVGITPGGLVIGEIPTPCIQRFFNSSTPIIDGSTIYVAGAGTGMHRFDVFTEGTGYNYREAWVNPKISLAFNTPVLKDGYLYGNESKSGYTFCLNAETGETAWCDTVKLNRFASTLDLGTTMLTLTANGVLVFYQPDPKAYRELARYKVADTEVYAHPLILENRIYIKDKDKLICWALM